MDEEAWHGCRAVLCVRRLAWGAGGGESLTVDVATRISNRPDRAPFWRNERNLDYEDGDQRLVGWIPEEQLLGLRGSHG